MFLIAAAKAAVQDGPGKGLLQVLQYIPACHRTTEQKRTSGIFLHRRLRMTWSGAVTHQWSISDWVPKCQGNPSVYGVYIIFSSATWGAALLTPHEALGVRGRKCWCHKGRRSEILGYVHTISSYFLDIFAHNLVCTQ